MSNKYVEATNHHRSLLGRRCRQAQGRQVPEASGPAHRTMAGQEMALFLPLLAMLGRNFTPSITHSVPTLSLGQNNQRLWARVNKEYRG